MSARTPVPRQASLMAMLALALGVSAVGCPCIRGPINSSDGLRWWLFSTFGAQKVCPEMLKKGVPLKIAALGPNTVGRFFPTQCQSQVNDADRSMAVNIGGTGYAYLPLARRVGFSAQARVEFRPDFRLESDAQYVWGRFSRMLEGPSLRVLGVENPLASAASRTPIGDIATSIGQGIAASEISRGFTVVRGDDGDEFALGILTPPERPARPFAATKDHVVLGADTVEIHASEREYLGPFSVESKDQVLFVKVRLAGAPLNVFLVDKAMGDAWRQPYEAAQPLGPPPGPVLSSNLINAGEGQQFFPAMPGLYYIVMENRAAPAMAPLGVPLPLPEAVSYLTYGIELGER